MQVEVDEVGHIYMDCGDEDARLEIIAADVGTPGVVLRIDPDYVPTLREVWVEGERTWEATSEFAPLMLRAAEFVRAAVEGAAPTGLRRFYLDAAMEIPSETRRQELKRRSTQ